MHAALAARAHLQTLAAEPRPAGSEAERRAREYCAARLSANGFSVTEEPFVYSAAPGRLATSGAGLASILLIDAAGHLGFRGHAWGALAVLALGGLALALGSLLLARRGVLALPWMRERGVNLVATRGTDAPTLWLLAHLDSKSQPVPIAVRALGVMATIVVWLAALATAVAQTAGVPIGALWPWIAVAGALAGAPVAASVVRARSPGALDDASGVATVLRAAELLSRERTLGVLLTSAEELGLAGARAWVRGREPGAGVAINVDGVDDAGDLRLTWTRRRPARILETLIAAATRSGATAAAARLLPGVLVDGVALADAGWSVVTISKGTWRTVARIHTPADDLSRLRGSGVEEVARVITSAIEEGL